MAAFTSKAAGNWSASGQTTWNQAGVPGSGDTVTISHNITVDVDTTVGSSPSTGGTAAVTTDTNGVVLTVAAGKVFRVQGDLLLNTPSYPNTATLTLAAGASLIIDPASGQQYKISTNQVGYINCSGSSGSHCTVKTDLTRGGTAAYAQTTAQSRSGGFATCSYTDFIDFGTSAKYGITYFVDDTFIGSSSITNCTFTRCSYDFAVWGDTGGWTGTYTFTNNIFASSVAGPTYNGIATVGHLFQILDTAATGTYLVQYCSFDLWTGIAWQLASAITFADNVFQAGITNPGSTTGWTSDTKFLRNVLYSDTALQLVYGPVKDCYMVRSTVVNPHFIQAGAGVTGAMSYTGMIFESFNSGAGGDGDCIFPTATSTTTSVKNCIVLPDATGLTSGKLVSGLQASTNVVTCEHNTYHSKGGESGLMALDETSSSYAGEVASCRANLIWSATAETNGYAIYDAGAGTPAVDAVTVAGYNGFWNPGTGTCSYNSSTSQAGVTGYKGIKVSVNHTYPNTAAGTGDISANPTFVDSTRNFKTWGSTQGADGTVAGALATLAANPALIGQSSTGLLAWVRAGFVPTNTAFQAASYAGDASTADAAGTSWPGGSPGIGAMAVLAAAGSAYFGSILRPAARTRIDGPARNAIYN